MPYIASLVRDCWRRFTKLSFWMSSGNEGSVPVPIECRGVRFDEGFRADIIVENKVIIELKSVERVINAHKKQVLTYLKLTGMRLGYLLNFGEAMMKRGITRAANGLPE